MKGRGDLLGWVGETVAARGLFEPGQSILVAVSGGLDSMVLLHLLRELAPRQGWLLTVAHLNHQLRGASSRADERLVRATAEAMKLPLVVERADVRSYARERAVSLEMAAREIRHEFLARAAGGQGIRVAALAHHADDQIELFFLRLFRGSGPEGLAGMKWRNASPASATLELVRPLLEVSKAALRQFAVENRIPFREDATNAALAIPRNRIRQELLPLLRRYYQPGLDRTLLRTMDILGAEAEAVDQQACEWLAGLERKASRTRPRFGALPLAVQRRCIQRQLLRLGVAAEFEWIEMLRLRPGEPVALPKSPLGEDVRALGGGLFAVRDELGCVRRLAPAAAEFTASRVELDLGTAGAGEVVFDGVRVEWRTEAKRGAQRPGPVSGQEILDAGKVGSRVELRHWQAGDRFQPIGMGTGVKLQDLFVNQKIPRAERHGLLVAATAEGRVFWVEGQRVGEEFKLTDRTKHRLHWRWKRL